jgi:uncharacterized membrane protein
LVEHLTDHWMGLLHVVFALASLLTGTLVLLRRKGNATHRRLGRAYLFSMLGLNLTALLNYELFGFFGPFHWMALISLASVLGGYLTVRRKRPGWKHAHAYFMTGSYVGLVAATVAEIASRIPGWTFGASVVVSSVLVILAGIIMMMRMLPAIIQKRH